MTQSYQSDYTLQQHISRPGAAGASPSSPSSSSSILSRNASAPSGQSRPSVPPKPNHLMSNSNNGSATLGRMPARKLGDGPSSNSPRRMTLTGGNSSSGDNSPTMIAGGRYPRQYPGGTASSTTNVSHVPHGQLSTTATTSTSVAGDLLDIYFMM